MATKNSLVDLYDQITGYGDCYDFKRFRLSPAMILDSHLRLSLVETKECLYC